MPDVYGAEFYGASGLVQMNSTDFNFVLRSKGVLTGWVPDPTWGSGVATYKTYLTVAGTAPVLAICGSDYVSVQSATFDGTNWVFYIISQYTVVSETIEYYCFDLAKTVTTADEYGMALYNDSGEVTFKIGHKPMRGIEFITLPKPSPVAETDYDAYEYRTVPAGKKYAIVQCGLFQMHEQSQWEFTDDPDYEVWRFSDVIQAAKIVGDTMTFNILWLYVHYEEVFVGGGGYVNHRDMSGCLQWMIIDVTGY